MSEAVLSALKSLQAALEKVDDEIRRLGELQVQRRRIVEAIRATEQVLGNTMPLPPEPEVPLVGTWTTVGQALARFKVANLELEQLPFASSLGPQGRSPSPSEAAEHVLRASGKPLHISRLIAGIHHEGLFLNRDYESLRGTIASTLDAKARAGDTIEKTAPATYGLLEWRDQGPR